MRRSEYGQSRNRAGMVIVNLALITLVVLTAAPLASGAPKNEKDNEASQIYQHTYDEVFQASQEAIERKGLFIKEKDKNKGTISGDGFDQGVNVGGRPFNIAVTFDIQIETVSTKPETQVTVKAQGGKGLGLFGGGYGKRFAQRYFVELQKVLATYH